MAEEKDLEEKIDDLVDSTAKLPVDVAQAGVDTVKGAVEIVPNVIKGIGKLFGG